MTVQNTQITSGKKSGDAKSDLRAYSQVRAGKIKHSTGKDSKSENKWQEDVNTKGPSMRPANSTSFKLSDYTWAEDYDPTTLDPNANLNPVQHMVITEFQPDFSYQWGEVYDLAAGAVETGVSMLPGGDLFKKAAVLALRQSGSTISQNLQKDYQQDPSKVVGLPMDFIKGLFAGTYLSTYEVPFFNETYLKADTTGNWSAGGAAQAIGEKAASIMKEAMNMDFPTTPTWQISDAASREAISVEFHLINNSDGALISNFNFLNSLVAGAYWIQMDYIQKSPNVYDIEVPGRFHMYFAAMGVEIVHVGKLRVNSGVSNSLSGMKSINANTLYPDAWKVTLNIQDLCPNNFNNYVEYLMKGKDGQVSVGTAVEKFNTNTAAKKIAGDAITGIKDAAGNVIKTGKEAIFGGGSNPASK